MDLAEILRLSGRGPEAEELVLDAIGLYQRKGDLVSEARARKELDELIAVEGLGSRSPRPDR
jgi:hypothetical protein